MQRGINIGNTMDCPTEGSWGNGLIKEYYFDDYKKAGYTHIRIPITWQGHTATTSPYKIDAVWLNRVEQVVDWGLKRGLIITINAHHDGFIKDAYTVQTNRDRFDSIWSQIATRFKGKSDSLLFEILNEPHSSVANMTISQVNDLNARVLSIIRKTNPTRIVIFSGNEYAAIDRMIAAAVPLNDTNLIAYFHSYDPWPFGLQGTGSYTDADTNGTKNIFDQAANWSKSKNIPVTIDEMGAISTCAYNSRMYCYFSVIDQALKHGIAFDAWDDGGSFTIYERNTHGWSEIKDILIYTYNESPTKLKISQPANDSIILKWTNRSTRNDSIIIERKTALNAEFDTIAAVGPDMETFIDTAVDYKKVYYYRLQTNIKDSIYPMSYPIAISVPYFKTPNADTTVADSFGIKLLKATDPESGDALTYKLTLDGLSLPKWLTYDSKTVSLKSNTNLPVPGVYTIIMTATDRSGQIAKDTFNLTIDYILGVKDTEILNGIRVYPNPANESIHIFLPLTEGNIELSIIDYLGRTVLTQKIQNLDNRTEFNLNTSSIPSGAYILKLKNSNSVQCKKIVINK